MAVAVEKKGTCTAKSSIHIRTTMLRVEFALHIIRSCLLGLFELIELRVPCLATLTYNGRLAHAKQSSLYDGAKNVLPADRDWISALRAIQFEMVVVVATASESHREKDIIR